MTDEERPRSNTDLVWLGAAWLMIGLLLMFAAWAAS